MARDITPDDWPVRVTDAQISAVTGAAAFARGRRYAETRRVSNLSVSGNGEIIAAAVRGSRGRVYQTMVFSESKGRPVDWRGSCSCPVGSDCKHTVALILAARRRGHCVDLVVGRERAPYGEEAGFLSWVEHNGSVLLTTAPVRRLYEEVARW